MVHRCFQLHLHLHVKPSRGILSVAPRLREPSEVGRVSGHLVP